MQNKESSILVCCHKKDYFYDGDGYIPIHVGKANSQIDLGILGDDTGDNISVKNPNFCELTAHYWLWKNGIKTKYVGLCHYRRYFSFYRNSIVRGGFLVSQQEIKDNPPKLPDLDNLLKNHDIILPKPYFAPYSLETTYCMAHVKNDIDILREVVEKKYPDYIPSYDKVMRWSNRLCPYNMFITSWEYFEEYSKWLFDILFEVERRIKLSAYPDQARVFGYMSERLLNVFVKNKKLRVKELPILMVTDQPNESLQKVIFQRLRNYISAQLTYPYFK